MKVTAATSVERSAAAAILELMHFYNMQKTQIK